MIGAILLVLQLGKGLHAEGIGTATSAAAEKHLSTSFVQAFSSPLIVFVMQLIVIIVVAQLFVGIVRRIGFRKGPFFLTAAPA